MSGDVIIFTVSRLFDGPGAVWAAAVSPAGGAAGLPPALPGAGETIGEGEYYRRGYETPSPIALHSHSKQHFLQLPDLSSESDSPGNGLAYRMPSLSMSRQSSGVKSRQNSSSRILLAREHTREEKAARIAVENK